MMPKTSPVADLQSIKNNLPRPCFRVKGCDLAITPVGKNKKFMKNDRTMPATFNGAFF